MSTFDAELVDGPWNGYVVPLTTDICDAGAFGPGERGWSGRYVPSDDDPFRWEWDAG